MPPPKLVLVWVVRRPRRRRLARQVELIDQRIRRRIAPITFKDNRQWMEGLFPDVLEKIVNGFRHVMQVIVEQPEFAARFRFDPAPAGEMNGAYSFAWHAINVLVRVEAEVDRVRVEIMQIEKQIALRRSQNFHVPVRFAHRAPGRIDQRGDVFHERRRADNLPGDVKVSRRACNRCGCSRRSSEMADFDSTASDKGQVFRPEFRAGLPRQAGRFALAVLIRPDGRRQSKRDAVQRNRHLARQGV